MSRPPLYDVCRLPILSGGGATQQHATAAFDHCGHSAASASISEADTSRPDLGGRNGWNRTFRKCLSDRSGAYAVSKGARKARNSPKHQLVPKPHSGDVCSGGCSSTTATARLSVFMRSGHATDAAKWNQKYSKPVSKCQIDLNKYKFLRYLKTKNWQANSESKQQ
jgi:hypothetical protein